MSKSRYIVRAREDEAALAAPSAPGALSDFLAGIESDPDIELVDTIGPAGRPHTAVIAVTQEQARALEQRIRNAQQLMIEPDRPLSLFG